MSQFTLQQFYKLQVQYKYSWVQQNELKVLTRDVFDTLHLLMWIFDDILCQAMPLDNQIIITVITVLDHVDHSLVLVFNNVLLYGPLLLNFIPLFKYQHLFHDGLRNINLSFVAGRLGKETLSTRRVHPSNFFQLLPDYQYEGQRRHSSGRSVSLVWFPPWELQ